MYTLMRVSLKCDNNIIVFDLWDYEIDSGFEIHKSLVRFQKEGVKKIHNLAREYLGKTYSIENWVDIIEFFNTEPSFKSYKRKQHKVEWRDW